MAKKTDPKAEKQYDATPGNGDRDATNNAAWRSSTAMIPQPGTPAYIEWQKRNHLGPYAYNNGLPPKEERTAKEDQAPAKSEWNALNFREDPVFQERENQFQGRASADAPMGSQETYQSLALQESQEVEAAGKNGLSKDRAAYYENKWRSYGREESIGRPINANSLQREGIAYFKSQGWTEAQAIGIVANITAESGMNAHIVGDNGQAYGFGQWHADRQAAFAKFTGHSIRNSSAQEQFAFVNFEMTQGSEKRAGDILRNTTNAAEAAAAVSTYYERPADTMGQANARAKIAERLEAGLPSKASKPDFNDLKVASTSGEAVSIKHTALPKPAHWLTKLASNLGFTS